MIELLYRFLCYFSTMTMILMITFVSVTITNSVVGSIGPLVVMFLGILACIQIFNIFNTYGNMCGFKTVKNVDLSWWEGA